MKTHPAARREGLQDFAALAAIGTLATAAPLAPPADI